MNIVQRDVMLMWRKPSYWLVMAVLAFLLGWIALVMTDLMLGQQGTMTQVAAVTEVTLARQLIAPFFSFVSLISLVLLALLAGQVISAERAAHSIHALLESGLGDVSVMAQKLMTVLILVLPLLLPVAVALWGWSTAATLDWAAVGWNLVAWVMLMLWFASLSLWLAVNLSQPGLAALLGLLITAVLWLMGQAGTGAEWGKNWIRVFSPRPHFEWLQSGVVPFSTVLYFIGGAIMLFALAVLSFKRLRLT